MNANKKLYFIYFYLLFIYQFSLFSQEKIMFLHIPKTGGVTVSYLLQKQYSLNESTGQNSLLISYGNHIYFYHYKHILPQYKLITFLRDPVERVLSEHRYCMEKHHGNPEILTNHFLPPQGDPIYTASNVACKVLSGLNPHDSSIDIQKHLTAAKKNLMRNFFFVGITEKMDESIKMLFTFLEWPPPNEIPHHNSTDDIKNEYSQEVLEGIASRNWADIELYEHAQKIFDYQKNYASLYESINSSTETKFSYQYNYTFDQPLDGTGWCLVEHSAIGVPYRWVSEENLASLNAPIFDNCDYLLNLELLIQPAFVNQFSLFINNHEVPILFNKKIYQALHEKFTWTWTKAVIPSELLIPNQKTKITLVMTPPEDPVFLEKYNKSELNQFPPKNFKRGKCAARMLKLKKINNK